MGGVENTDGWVQHWGRGLLSSGKKVFRGRTDNFGCGVTLMVVFYCILDGCNPGASSPRVVTCAVQEVHVCTSAVRRETHRGMQTWVLCVEILARMRICGDEEVQWSREVGSICAS